LITVVLYPLFDVPVTFVIVFVLVFIILRRLPNYTLFPYTTLFRSQEIKKLKKVDEIMFNLQDSRYSQKKLLQAGELLKKLNLIEDRKSTRLNSSHVSISYAVFCLKKKTIKCGVPLI